MKTAGVRDPRSKLADIGGRAKLGATIYPSIKAADNSKPAFRVFQCRKDAV
jgi:hypothetical protein